MRAPLRDLPRAPRILILTGPLFAPAALAAPFALAFQEGLGFSAPQIGLLASASAGLGFVFLGVGSLASERWGRLRALTLFDGLGFVLPALLLAAARTPGQAALAVLLGATAQGAQAGFQGLLLGELRAGERSRVLGWEHVLLALPSVAMPLAAAAAVAALGLDAGVRLAYVLAAASVAAMVAIRWAALRGHSVPRGPPQPLPWRATLAGLRGAGLGPVLAGSCLLSFAGGLGALAQLRVVDVLRLDAWWLGPFAFAATAADLAASGAAARGRWASRRMAIAAALAGGAGAALFLAARGPAVLLASGAMMGFAGAWAGVGTGASLHDAVPEGLRERASAALLAMRALGGLAGPALAGALWSLDPSWPWAASAVAFVAAAAMLALAPRDRSAPRAEPSLERDTA